MWLWNNQLLRKADKTSEKIPAPYQNKILRSCLWLLWTIHDLLTLLQSSQLNCYMSDTALSHNKPVCQKRSACSGKVSWQLCRHQLWITTSITVSANLAKTLIASITQSTAFPFKSCCRADRAWLRYVSPRPTRSRNIYFFNNTCKLFQLGFCK